MAFLGLDVLGFLTALIIGSIVYLYLGLNALLILLTFFIFSIYVTSIGYKQKHAMKLYDYQRGAINVISNGFFPALFAFLNMPYAFIASVSAITADKFASEIGVLGDNPKELFTFKEVKKGKSGAVSSLGLIASFTGSLTIALVSSYFYTTDPLFVIIITFAGFLGSLSDSIAGFFEERGFGNKATSNLICALTGGLTGQFILKIFGF
jgi:uncharacterized protein (TIGR00297 family)